MSKLSFIVLAGALLLSPASLVAIDGNFLGLDVHLNGGLTVGHTFADLDSIDGLAYIPILPFYDFFLRTTVDIGEHSSVIAELKGRPQHEDLVEPFLLLSQREEESIYTSLGAFPDVRVSAAYFDLDLAGFFGAKEEFNLRLQPGYFELVTQRNGTIGDIVNITHRYSKDTDGRDAGDEDDVDFADESYLSCGFKNNGCDTADGGFYSSKSEAVGMNVIIGRREVINFSAGALFHGIVQNTDENSVAQDPTSETGTWSSFLLNLYGAIDEGIPGTISYSTFLAHNHAGDNVIGTAARYSDIPFGNFLFGVGAEFEIDQERTEISDDRGFVLPEVPSNWEWAANTVLGYDGWLAFDVSVRGEKKAAFDAAGAGVALNNPEETLGFQVGFLTSGFVSSPNALVYSLYPEIWAKISEVRLSVDTYIADLGKYLWLQFWRYPCDKHSRVVDFLKIDAAL